MLPNNADARRCSYFDLGLPVVRTFRCSASYRQWRPSWFSNVPRGRASGIIALVGGGGREKYFSRFLPNRPRPLSSFDNHARWQPVTQSARSRRSYGKIEDCKQSSFSVVAAAAATGRVYIIYGGWHSDSSKTLINSWRQKHHKKHLKSKTVL